MKRKFKNGWAYTSIFKICSYGGVIIMNLLKQFFLYLKYKIRYRRVSPKHTPKISGHSTKMPSSDRKLRAAGYQ